MAEETFLRLQHSEGIVCHMAAQLLAAYIGAGQLTPANETQLIEHTTQLAIKLAHRVDKAIESDDENDER